MIPAPAFGRGNPDAAQNRDNAASEINADRLPQHEGGEHRGGDRIEGECARHAGRRRAVERRDPEKERQRTGDRAEIEQGQPLGCAVAGNADEATL